jgi:non-homologous end joining protein Ku
MAPRSIWNGYLKLSLVSCPIALYPAISTAERLSFRQVNKATGNRLRQQLIDAGTGERVARHEMGRGYEIGDEQFVVVQDEELEAARRSARTRAYGPAAASVPEEPAQGTSSRSPPATRAQNDAESAAANAILPPRPKVENTHTIEVERFVPRSQIDARYYLTPYYITPRGETDMEPFAVIRDAMARTELVGMGHVVLSNRERPILVEPMGKGLRAMTLRYTHEVRDEAQYFSQIPELTLPKEMLGIADRILEAMKSDFDPARLEDRYRTALVAMLRNKRSQVPTASRSAVPSPANVINLMDVLRRSLAAKQSPAQRSGRKPTRTAAAASARPGPRKRSRASQA